jgi:predicted DNA-binding protein with PD1-like motif
METRTHAIRLKPGQDLNIAIREFVIHNNIRAGWVLACVGSLTEYRLRFANQANANTQKGFFEIISLSGTLSKNGSHLHISVGDDFGRVTGGHLLDGCTIYTTAEIIIGESLNLIFTRETDATTGWKELQIGSSEL